MSGEPRARGRQGWRLIALVLMMLFTMTLPAQRAWADEAPAAIQEPSAASAQTSGSGDRLLNFGLVYSAQWLVYGLTQGSTIGKHGSFQNWVEYPSQPHFDNDDFEFNLFKHSLAGGSYYLFYRSRGYEVRDAFLWSFASSLAFEFTIETYTERPSYQDIYQTPVFGTLLGVGLEAASRRLVSSSSSLVRFFGYVLNPFALFPNSDLRVGWRPSNSREGHGPIVSVSF